MIRYPVPRNLVTCLLAATQFLAVAWADNSERLHCGLEGTCPDKLVSSDAANSSFSGPSHALAAVRGEQVFAERCAKCHNSSVIEPSVAGLAKLEPQYIYRTLWSGIMREAAVGLNDAERWAVAQYLGNLVPEKPSAELSNFCATQTTADPAVTGYWGAWAPDPRNHRHLADSALTLAQMARASLKWAFVIPDTGSTTNAGNQPTVHDGRLYIGSRSGFVFALDARSGCIHWSYRPVAGVRSAISINGGKAIFADYENYVYALDAPTGELLWRNKADDQPSARVNGSLTVHDGRVFVPVATNQGFVNALDPRLPCCTFQGTLTAFDIHSGRRLWQAKLIDAPIRELGRSPAGTMRYGPSGGSVWSVPTVDARRGLLYLGTSNQKTGPPVPESDAVVALDLATGAKQWVRSFAPKRFGGMDIWNGGCVGVFADPEQECPPDNETLEGDRDIGSPIVLQTRADGREILLAATKDGMLHALDPDRDGELIWETRVGKIIHVRGPSFGGVEHGIAADGARAYVPIADIDVLENTAAGALVAIDLLSGEISWRAEATDAWCRGKPNRCYTSMTSPPTVAGEIVFAGANDGVLRAYDRNTGSVAWSFDTVVEVAGVNGLSGSGGSISRGGTAVVDGMFFQSSGYGQGLGMPGNVVFAFQYPQD